jgi:hypothetical protein
VSAAPSEIQLPDEQPALAFEQRKNSTLVTSPSGLVARTVNGSASAALT